MVAGPLRPAARADQEVDGLLLAHDDVLETVLERLGAALAAGRGDGVLEGVDALRLDLDEVVDDRARSTIASTSALGGRVPNARPESPSRREALREF